MCWHHTISRRRMDAPDWPQSDGRVQRFLRGKSFLIMDRDSSFHEAFRDLIEQEGIRAVRIRQHHPTAMPIWNAFTAHLKERLPTG